MKGWTKLIHGENRMKTFIYKVNWDFAFNANLNKMSMGVALGITGVM